MNLENKVGIVFFHFKTLVLNVVFKRLVVLMQVVII